ncbi:hypothetical protein L1987_36178 [Smallanthus sonchifolius]|uniref:Uncharacterized protein n=1 Tax=Smallanthus sonchifolius TaxID=185202 RepID=A0ACB9HCQ5_9ASTR|nr:hypothetical protein L1987_36178 [Smallanthus sonchifolius]
MDFLLTYYRTSDSSSNSSPLSRDSSSSSLDAKLERWRFVKKYIEAHRYHIHISYPQIPNPLSSANKFDSSQVFPSAIYSFADL